MSKSELFEKIFGFKMFGCPFNKACKDCTYEKFKPNCYETFWSEEIDYFTWHLVKTADDNPKVENDYIVSFQWIGDSGTVYEEVEIAYYSTNDKLWDIEYYRKNTKVLAWMNRPEFYKGENNGGKI